MGIRNILSLGKFESGLKTNLFKVAFSVKQICILFSCIFRMAPTSKGAVLLLVVAVVGAVDVGFYCTS